MIQSEDTEKEDFFELQVNSVSLSKLEFLNLDFKLIDEEVAIFDGHVSVNGKSVADNTSEWRPATLSHRIVEAIEDNDFNEIRMNSIMHPTSVTNEALSVLTTLNKSSTSLSRLMMGSWGKLDEKVSPTVLE